MEIIIHDLPEKKLKNIYKSTDNSLIISDDKKIKKVAAGIIKPSKTDVQVIIGPLVEFVANEMKKL